MSRFAPTDDESRQIALRQQDRAERLAQRILAARGAVMRGEGREQILWLLGHDDYDAAKEAQK